MTDSQNTATYESKAEAVESEQDFVKLWLDQIAKSDGDEKDWREYAEKAEDTYRAKAGAKNLEFNIFHSNIETTVPALYNSTPIPDVRRRFADKDPVGKIVSDILERGLSFQVDAYDFDGTMVSAIKDSEIVDRGVVRVRYVPYLSGEGEQEQLVDAKVTCEHVLWRDFRRGPGRFWGEVPWIAFRHYLSKDEIAKLIPDDINIEDIPLNYSSDGTSSDKAKDAKADVFKRGMVWEIWEKDGKKVLFICQDYHERVLKSEDDPLELTNFFPVPKPLMSIEQPGSLVPVTPLKIYDKLVDELNTITKRLSKLIRTLRPRGLYGGSVEDMKAVANADDGELVPATDVMAFLQAGGIEKAIAWYPLDPTVKAVQVLYEQRERIKQTIYEVTGIADILRGSTDPNETLGAQQLKAQWGSLRIQRRQQEVARFARDLFEIKAEIIATKFPWPLLSRMTGIELPSEAQKQQAQAMLQQVSQAQQSGQQVPPQIAKQAEQMAKMAKQPSQEEVMQLLQDDVARNYRVDIESDSTIRNDLSRNQQTMNLFLQGTAQFATAMGPIIMADPSMKPGVMEIYGAFARQFKLGRQAEDAIEAMTEQAEKTANQPQQPDPKIEAEKAKAAAEQEKIKLQAEVDQQKAQAESEKIALQEQAEQAKHAREMERLAAEAGLEEQKRQAVAAEHQRKLEETQLNDSIERQRQNEEFGRNRAMADEEHRRTIEAGEAESARKDREESRKFELAEAKAARDEERAANAEKRKAENEKAAQSAKAKEPKADPIDLKPILTALEKLDKRLDKIESAKPTSQKIVRDKDGRMEAILSQ